MTHASDGYMQKVHELNERYFSAGAPEAKQAMVDEIALVGKQDYDPSQKVGQAHVIWLAYCRLYYIDIFVHDVNSAASDLRSAKEWLKKELELSNPNAQKKVESEVDDFGAEQCIAAVKQWDGRVPAFAKGSSPGEVERKDLN